MRLMQVDRQPGERSPVGGHGAGLAAWRGSADPRIVKVGGEGDPVRILRSELERTAPWTLTSGSTLVLGHVRRASPSLEDTIPYEEAAQPYIADCRGIGGIIGLHNGYVANYKSLVSQEHRLESVGRGLVDSEVLPHLLEELLAEGTALPEAVDAVGQKISGGGSTVCFVATWKAATWVALLHVGKTRGLSVWENDEGELVFISRPRCLGPGLSLIIEERGLEETFTIGRQEPGRFQRLWPVRALQPERMNCRP
jgi:glutamine phosphoribosylpyrophosphate amidotransferase